jgi:phage shock protein A
VDDDLIQSLTRFHQEVVMPDFREALQTESGNLRREVLSHFDDLYHRFDRLETEYQSLVAGVGRVEKRMLNIERRLEKLDVREELETLKTRVADLQDRIARLESEL